MDHFAQCQLGVFAAKRVRLGRYYIIARLVQLNGSQECAEMGEVTCVRGEEKLSCGGGNVRVP